jgi:hypothetical protein
MADINIWTIILIAFFTGFGSGIGNPVGQHLYEKYIKDRLVKTTNNVEGLKDKIKNEVIKSVENTKNIEEKILGKKE